MTLYNPLYRKFFQDFPCTRINVNILHALHLFTEVHDETRDKLRFRPAPVHINPQSPCL